MGKLENICGHLKLSPRNVRHYYDGRLVKIIVNV